MNGSLQKELIDTYFWEIMEDYCGEKVDNMSDKEAEKIAKTEAFQIYADKWVSEEVGCI